MNIWLQTAVIIIPCTACCKVYSCTVYLARERGEVGPTRGITVIAAPGAAAAAVMPGVWHTRGRGRGRD